MFFAPKNDIYDVKIVFYSHAVERLGIKRIRKINNDHIIPCDSTKNINHLGGEILRLLNGKIWSHSRKVYKLTVAKYFSNKEYVDIEINVRSYI